ncbi:MAG: hypothetical protein ACK41E_11100 [Deinococcales bacterium]
MNQTLASRRPVVDYLTATAIAAIAISLNVAAHEGVHALTCRAIGGDLREYSALYVSCDGLTSLQMKLLDGSAPTFNLIMGVLLWFLLARTAKQTSEVRYFIWLSMLMNLLYGAGNWMFSGIAGVGDMATVVSGWEPSWLWRSALTVIGSALYMFFIWLALREFGKMVGGSAEEQFRRANLLCLLAYVTAVGVILAASFLSPPGLLSLPVTAGLFAVLGALSPLLWMMQWFQSNTFIKPARAPLEIRRQWQWVVAALFVTFAYVFVLGRTFYF